MMSIHGYLYKYICMCIYVYTNQPVSIVSLGMTWTPSLKPTTVFPGSSTWTTPGELFVSGIQSESKPPGPKAPIFIAIS